MLIFSLVSIVAFFILGIIWSKSDFTNLMIKVGFFGMCVWGLIATNIFTVNL